MHPPVITKANAESQNKTRNRLNLLGLLRNHARVLADFGAVVKS